MKMHLDELIPQITEFLKNEANTETVIGKQFQLGEFSCVPVIRVGMGFGSGLGEGDAQNKATVKAAVLPVAWALIPLASW